MSKEIYINNFEPFCNEGYDGIVISWSKSGVGFGEYTIFRKTGADEWFADSECMDSNDDKSFIKELMDKFIDELKIV